MIWVFNTTACAYKGKGLPLGILFSLWTALGVIGLGIYVLVTYF